MLAFAVPFLSSCASHPSVALFQDRDEVFHGQTSPRLNVDIKLFVGGGKFSLRGDMTGMQCQGHTAVTQIPDSNFCSHQQGSVNAKCDDGRRLTGKWTAESCKIGFGDGQDDAGNAFAYTFGLPEERAIKRIEKYLGVSVGESNLNNTRQRR